MAPRKTSFNQKWKQSYPWINSVPKENFKAYCKLCQKIFSVAAKGEGCVTEHAESTKHKEAERAAGRSNSLNRFFSRMYRLSLFNGMISINEKKIIFK